MHHDPYHKWHHFLMRFYDRKFVRLLFFKTVGNFFVLLSLFFTFRTFYEPIKSEVWYYIDKNLVQRTYVVEDDSPEAIPLVTPPPSQLAQFFNIRQVETLVPIDPEYSIVIPKIAANARVIANVDPSNEQEYLEKLKVGVAHTAGTYMPGQGGHIYMFAHSTDYLWNIGVYNAIFYLLYKLEPGDEINIYHKGVRHVYVVEGNKVIDPNEVEYITRKTDGEFLTLQTCWPPGTTLKRLLVFARPKVR